MSDKPHISARPRWSWKYVLPVLVGVLAMTLAGEPTAEADGGWKPAAAPLMTKYSADVTAEHARPEYPRPLLVRKEWRSLNGIWQFAFDDAKAGETAGWSSGKDLPDRILVPFTFEAALSGIGKGKEIHENVWYRRTVDIPGAWSKGGKRVLLHFGAVDWKATVFVNGKVVGDHTGGYSPFTFDITDSLKPGNLQEIVVKVFDPADPKSTGYQPKGKQLGSEGIWYTRTTGIWQSVWIEPVATTHIETVRADTDVAASTLKFTIKATAADAVTVNVAVSLNGIHVSQATSTLSGAAVVSVPLTNPQYWSPETPSLYDVSVSLVHGGKTLDQVQSYAAYRQAGIENGRLTLNGKPYFYRGVLDQGYWPDGILTPPTDTAIKHDVEMVKKLGFNMARKHVKIEDPRWYFWCDKLGVAVWQDMPSSHNLSTQEAKDNFTREWKDAMETTRGYPCVVHWIPFNENWGNPQAFQDEIVNLTRSIDPTRPITDASGWTQRGLTDVIDAHDYGNNLRAQGVDKPVKPKVVGEFGGIALPLPGHTWSTGWGYQSVKDADGLVKKICFQTTQLFEAANLSGYVYTQLTDVEQELNGLLTYDRQPKADLTKIAGDFTGVSRSTQPAQISDWYVLGPIPAGTNLTSAEDSAANRAIMDRILAREYVRFEAQLEPDDKSTAAANGKQLHWQKVHEPSGMLDFIKLFGGQINNSACYAVAYIDSKTEQHNATLYMGADDGCRVWLNGKHISTVAKIRGVGLDDDVIPGLSLRQGKNVLVVKIGQGTGGWGLTARMESEPAAK